ncbi:Tripartite-type tricarboxylate transporter, receptor component TctC [Roseomonas rosea]|uniref:Tripartite-type tricarboxylate transporter, receptor component TctC n=1 Tax=Muricoccus roseus TaxID=198092 RepID=A0A1M6HKE1_9PROT|nr:tripartite tricarboxylate transporter substrate binding protein [Roseomonas rosea]SHJ22625.1 Tripartite-type tricarboxylate transporter, receptor component TctC [Roseomonas rosea]
MIARRALLASALAAPRIASAQGASWPGDRQVKVIVPLAPGGTADVFARLISSRMSERSGGRGSMVVENRTGGGNAVGWQAAARAAPDGNTLLMTDNSLAMSAPLRRDLGFDPQADLVPVCRVADLAPVICVPDRSPIRTVQDLVAAAQRRPGEMFYGSGGNGSAPHLASELLQDVAGIRMNHVSYRGMAQASQDLAAGRLDMAIAALPTVAGLLRDGGQIRVIAVGAGERAPALPDVPTVRESGLDYALAFWFGLFAPKGTSAEAAAAMSQAMVQVIREPYVTGRLEELGAVVVASDPDSFRAAIRSEVALWERIVRERKIVL